MNAQPHPNGDTRETFRKEGRRLWRAANQALESIKESKPTVLNGRNYQHMTLRDAETSIRADIARFEEALSQIDKAVSELKHIGHDIYKEGDQG